DKALYIYEIYGNIYKSITKFDGKNFNVIMKNKDIYSNEYRIGKYIFVVPTNSLGPTKTMYQNIEMSTQKDITKKLKRIDRNYDMVIFPVVVAGDNIIYTCDYSIFALNTKTNKIKTLANNTSKVQFLKNGYDYYLRILNNPKDVSMFSRTKDFDLASKYIDLQSLNTVNIENSKLDKMHVGKVKDWSIYEVRDIEQYFRNDYRAHKAGFLF
ncbi:hypothetical protein, partial [Poseidonibacter sp.]|uniref:hypothetical protein n=1 Tax=Poseidonibacter sp. TaxID=2321188 RepID=UPI003C7550B0